MDDLIPVATGEFFTIYAIKNENGSSDVLDDLNAYERQFPGVTESYQTRFKRMAGEGVARMSGHHFHRWKHYMVASGVATPSFFGAFKDLRSQTRIPVFTDGPKRMVLTHLLTGKKEDDLTQSQLREGIRVIEAYRAKKAGIEYVPSKSASAGPAIPREPILTTSPDLTPEVRPVLIQQGIRLSGRGVIADFFEKHEVMSLKAASKKLKVSYSTLLTGIKHWKLSSYPFTPSYLVRLGDVRAYLADRQNSGRFVRGGNQQEYDRFRKIMLQCDLSLISKSERELLEAYYGLNGKTQRSQAELAAEQKRTVGAIHQAFVRARQRAMSATFEKGIT